MSISPSALASAVSGGDQAPDVQFTAGDAPNVGGPAATPIPPPVANQAIQQQAQNPVAGVSPTQPTSRLQSVLGAVANAVSTGLSGIPSQGRPSFVTGLGQGARAEQQAQATQQAIRFKDIDTQIRLASLAAQDKELQLRTQAQADAHQQMQNQQADWDEQHGITYDPHPNDGTAVMNTLQGQTAANGYASVPAGTHLVHDGEQINIPSNDSDTQAGLLQKYRQLAGVIPGIPNFPGQDKADHVPARNLDVMTHVLVGTT